jgi:hypothetical protein
VTKARLLRLGSEREEGQVSRAESALFLDRGDRGGGVPMRPIVHDVIYEIENVGGHVDKTWRGRHWRVRWSIGTAKFTATIPVTPSGPSSLWNATADIRRKARAALEGDRSPCRGESGSAGDHADGDERWRPQAPRRRTALALN